MLRLDLLDAEISGNKWFKLKRNIEAAKSQGLAQIISFGGPHSNHLAALAAVCRRENYSSVGVIRGERPIVLSDTLLKAKQDGMSLKFVSRSQYDQKNNTAFLNLLQEEFGAFYFIPEGGSNGEGLMGCMEIVANDWEYDYVVCACGTGTTFGGLVAAGMKRFSVLGISVLKGSNQLPAQVTHLLKKTFPDKSFPVIADKFGVSSKEHSYSIASDYAFSGFAGFEKQLVDFKHAFEERFDIPLDYLYTNKLFFGVFDLMEKSFFPEDSKILVIHSGGLQGNQAFERRYQLRLRR